MKQWSIPMPKEAPKEGKTHFAMACKDKNGLRIEFKCQIDATLAAEIVTKIILAAGQPEAGG